MLSFKKQKGQGLTEFALILPLLLLLLLGIIEASRIIWAYITVQTAAREAARYAVTGRPYLDALLDPIDDSQQIFDVCRLTDPDFEPEPTLSEVQPWLCQDSNRVEAVKQIAVNRGGTLAVSKFCLEPAEFLGQGGDTCNQTPGAFGVFVRGQVVTDTVAGPEVVEKNNSAGSMGLLVQVTTFYNIEMITPIYDVLMGNRHLQLRGSVQLQNEGLDETLGIEPPPALNPPPDPNNPNNNPPSASNKIIRSVSGYQLTQSQSMVVHLDGHTNANQYDIYLIDANNSNKKYLICSDVSTNSQNKTQPNPSCSLLTAGVEPGTYRLVSMVAGITDPIEAEGDTLVTVTFGGTPSIQVQGGTIWAAKEKTTVKLLFHNASLKPYTVKLYDGDDKFVANLATNHSGLSNDPIEWTVHDLEAMGKPVCGVSSGTYCYIRSLDKDGNERAKVRVNINQPKLVLSPDPLTVDYIRGSVVFISLEEHTPGKSYNIQAKTATGSPQAIAVSNDINAVGSSNEPIRWMIPVDCGNGTNLPDGTYTISSHELGESAVVAKKGGAKVKGAASPTLSVDGGLVWPAGSTITIRLIKHETNTTHYLEFGNQRIPTNNAADTFQTDGCGLAAVTFKIPVTTAKGKYTISSFLNNGTFQAKLTIEVLGVPTIQVLEGARVAPDQTITIRLANHAPNQAHRIVYGGKEIIKSVSTDGAGKRDMKYDLSTLPGPPLNLGVPYTMASVSLVTGDKVAETTLTMAGVDLEVTKVEIPANLKVNTMAPVTITVRNNENVAINRWFDIDMYLNPDPVAPSYVEGYNFPGDMKFWKDKVGPNETFIITATVPVTGSGLQAVYGFADTTNFVYEEELSGEVANSNNLKNKPFTVDCGVPLEDTFSTNYGPGAEIPGWSYKTFGNGGNDGNLTSVSGGALSLDSSGQSIWTNNDDTSGAGQLSFYRTKSVDSSNGLEVEVQVISVERLTTNSKAGIEIRSDINDPSSARVVYEVVYDSSTTSNPPKARPSYRNQNDGMNTVNAGQSYNLNSGSLWLRIRRDPGTNTFKYYARQGGTPPDVDADLTTRNNWWGAAKATQTVSSIGANVYVGLFNASYSANTAGTSKFGEIRFYPDNSACLGQAGQSPNDFPPGLTICNELLEDRSFEQTLGETPWLYDLSTGIIQSSTGERSGNFSLFAPTFDATFYAPAFSQKITLPEWIISGTTTLDMSFYKRVRSQMSNVDDRKADKFRAVISTGATPGSGTNLTQAVEVLDGSSAVGIDQLEPQALLVTKQFTVANGINLADYAEEEVYLHLYNNSNKTTGTCPNSNYPGGRCATEFYFDDTSLYFCTSQPKPNPINTRLSGQISLLFSDGSVERPAGVKVWAYAPDGKVYETFTIQEGLFNFYNLPPGEYTVFAQHVLVNPNDPTQIETLAASGPVELTGGNDDTQPATIFLKLITLEPLN